MIKFTAAGAAIQKGLVKHGNLKIGRVQRSMGANGAWENHQGVGT